MTAVNILIVEDELLIAQNLARKLRKIGYQVVDVVSSGEAAIQAVIDKNPDLVLMDIVIQGAMDGIEAAAKLREISKIPVIYLTAYADDKTLERAKLTDPLGYILKPFKEQELRVTIELALSRHRSEVEVYQALENAEELRKTVQQSNLKKTEHISMVSHEFRTPLSIIQMTAELLQNYDDRLTSETKKNHLQRIQSATQSMSQILEGVLTLGKVEHSKVETATTPIDVVRFCEELIEALQYATGEKYTFQFINCSEHSQAYLNEKLLWHILNNLLSNAVKYSPGGGKISLTFSTTENDICFQIEDQGIGISKEDQLHLFEPFQRATNVGEIPGTGLGLAIVKHLVDSHHGKIIVHSQLHVGTTFQIILPTYTNFL